MSEKHLSSHHADTLAKIFAHPTNHNIHWNDIVSLLGEVGTIEQKHDGKFLIHLGGEMHSIARPSHKDIDTQMIVDLRRMLRAAGHGPAH